MKMWRRMVGILLAAVLSAVGMALVLDQGGKDCCLCGSFRYHAPCLIDLETGKLIELGLYLPHESLVAEIADSQPEQGTFSFVCLGDVAGIKETSRRRIELDVPAADKTGDPALCGECRKQLQPGHTGRYVLADLYDAENKVLISIADQIQRTVRCYEITMTADREKDGITVVVEGTLKNKTGRVAK